MSDPYAQLPGEGDSAYRAFQSYLNMELPRSIARLAKMQHRSTTLFERWSSKYSWRLRVLGKLPARSDLLTQAEARAIQKTADLWTAKWAESRARDLEASTLLRDRAMAILAGLGLEKTSLSEISRALSVASELSARACGRNENSAESKPTGQSVNIQIALPKNGREPEVTADV